MKTSKSKLKIPKYATGASESLGKTLAGIRETVQSVKSGRFSSKTPNKANPPQPRHPNAGHKLPDLQKRKASFNMALKLGYAMGAHTTAFKTALSSCVAAANQLGKAYSDLTDVLTASVLKASVEKYNDSVEDKDKLTLKNFRTKVTM